MTRPVLHVYSGNLYGGVETMLATLAGKDCSQVISEFALCFEGRLSAELRSLGAPVHLLGPARLSNLQSIWRARAALSRLLRCRRFSAVICHAFWSYGIFASVVRGKGLPVLCWVHDEPKANHWMDRLSFLSLPDKVICNSRFVAGQLKNIWPGARSEIIYCPVRPAAQGSAEEHREAVRAELATPPGTTVIIQASRFESWKGHSDTITALRELGDGRRWEAWFVGGMQRESEAKYVDRLRQAVRDFQLESRVRFLGQRSDVPRLLAAADIYCQPNTAPEPFGVAFVEALAAKLPVVATGLGASLEILDSTCAILVAPENTSALSAALKFLIDSPSARKRLGAVGPSRAKLISSPQVQAAKLAAVIESLPSAA